MICKFFTASLENIAVNLVNQGELIWMHRDSDFAFSDEVTDFFELRSEIVLPVECVDGV